MQALVNSFGLHNLYHMEHYFYNLHFESLCWGDRIHAFIVLLDGI